MYEDTDKFPSGMKALGDWISEGPFQTRPKLPGRAHAAL